MFERTFVSPLRGQQRLWVVFWFYWVLGAFLIDLVFSLIEGSGMKVRLYLATLCVFVVYVGLALWRCAFNVSQSWLGYVARGLVVLNIAGVPLIVYLAVRGDLKLAS